MVHIFVISLILFPIVTALDDDFWNDVDTKYKELSDPEGLSTQATLNDLSNPKELPTQASISEAQQVGPLSEVPRSNNRAKTRAPQKKSTSKHVSFFADEMIPFEQAITINSSYSNNLSETEIIEKLLKLGDSHEWAYLRLLDVQIYFKYWAKVCTFFSELNLTDIKRVMCRLSPTFGMAKQRQSEYRGRIQFLDVLKCNCHGYQMNYYIPATSKTSFLIHQCSTDEFFVFEQKKKLGHNRLFIKKLRGGITLPNPMYNISLNQ